MHSAHPALLLSSPAFSGAQTSEVSDIDLAEACTDFLDLRRKHNPDYRK